MSLELADVEPVILLDATGDEEDFSIVTHVQRNHRRQLARLALVDAGFYGGEGFRRPIGAGLVVREARIDLGVDSEIRDPARTVERCLRRDHELLSLRRGPVYATAPARI